MKQVLNDDLLFNKIIIDKNSDINTIQKGLKLINPLENTLIVIKEGTYFEKIKIKFYSPNGKWLKIIGEGKVTISYNDFAKKIHNDGLEFNTFRTSTMMLLGNDIYLENLNIENTSGSGKKYGQAVALYVTGNNICINHCNLYAYQDTLFLGPLPYDLIERYQNFLQEDELIYPKEHKVYISNTFITGDVDFIFGGAEAYFEFCEFKSRKRNGFVFAPSTEQEEKKGFVVNKCRFTCEDKNTSCYIARPWRDYGMVELYDCLMDNHIKDVGFDKWNDTSRDKTCRFFEQNSEYFDNHQFIRCYFVNNNKK